MLRCPTCGRPFEPGAHFCPDDGSRLVTDAPQALPQALPPQAPASSVLPVLVGVLVAAVVGLVGVLLWQGRPQAEQPAHLSAVPADVPARAVERPPVQQAASPPAEVMQTVWANAPRDGYLVLRQGPRTVRGTEILRIPHGAALAVGACRAPTASPGGRYGSWCRARYGAAEGWVFDAFIAR